MSLEKTTRTIQVEKGINLAKLSLLIMEKSDNSLCLQQLSIFVPESNAVINVLNGYERIKLDLDRWNDWLLVDIFNFYQIRFISILLFILYLTDPSSSGKSCKSLFIYYMYQYS